MGRLDGLGAGRIATGPASLDDRAAFVATGLDREDPESRGRASDGDGGDLGRPARDGSRDSFLVDLELAFAPAADRPPGPRRAGPRGRWPPFPRAEIPRMAPRRVDRLGPAEVQACLASRRQLAVSRRQ